MTDLRAEIVPATELTASDREAMFALMDLVYDGMRREAFEQDLAGKDAAILLRTPSGGLVGFSTQRTLTVSVGEEVAEGVFSGDTVIHPAHWGSPVLSQAFARRYIAERERPLWWFLVSKGHRTYRFLPTFFTAFWPDRRSPTPPREQRIMDAYAAALFGDAYDAGRGVVAYATPKDRVRPGIADIAERELANPDIAHFVALNPGHVLGHDLVCLAELSPSVIKPRMRSLLFGVGTGRP